ncbi:MAG: dipeptidase PepE [Candidatus Paceibacterota bacterium]
MKQLFLISSSRYQDGKFWGHCLDDLKNFLGPAIQGKNKIVFIPYAKANGGYTGYTDYTKMVSEPFAELGYELVDITSYPARDCFSDPSIIAICIGGGNTWTLAYWLHEFELIHRILGKVSSCEWKYISASAGTVVACPSMMTTNDMAPIFPRSDKALGLVPFQINPHFVSGALVEKHMGETRGERIQQFLMWNQNQTVIGLPEGCWIVVENDEYILKGKGEAVIFKNAKEPTLWLPGKPYPEKEML